MTISPAIQIQDAERKLQRAILHNMEKSYVQRLANDFTKETGLLVHSIEIEFVDCSRLDGTKEAAIADIRVNREEA